MNIKLDLQHWMGRLAIAVPVLCGAAAFLGFAAKQFIVSTLSSQKASVATVQIEAAANYFSQSAPLQAQMASRLIESSVSLDESYEREVARAVEYASRAVKLAPRNFEHRLLLAASLEMNGDPATAEQELRAALELGPNQLNVHWRLANFLIRAGKPKEASREFRIVNAAAPERTLDSLDLLWQASEGGVETTSAAVGNNVQAQLTLATFLVQQEMFEAAERITKGFDKSSMFDSPEFSQLLDALITAGQVEPANRLWRESLGDDDHARLWNGSFERPIRRSFATFDWRLSPSQYAEIGISVTTAKLGRRSLKIAYRGVETTRIDEQIQQLIPARPGAQYTLSWSYKSENFSSPEGPRIVISTLNDSKLIAESASVASGSEDWRSESIKFVAPQQAYALIVSIQQTPQYSYVAPSQGSIWFDDFVLTENQPKEPRG